MRIYVTDDEDSEENIRLAEEYVREQEINAINLSLAKAEPRWSLCDRRCIAQSPRLQTSIGFRKSLATHLSLARSPTLKIEYFNGSFDPKGHLKSFIISVARAKFKLYERDAGLSHLFVEHLKGPALDWFSRLKGNSVESFQELSTLFLKQYSMLIDPGTSDADLWSLSQQPNEPLRDFLAKFRSTLAKVEGFNDIAALSTLKNALWYKSEFQKKLNLSKQQTIRDTLHRASDYVSHEEEMELLSKRHEPSKQTSRDDKSQPGVPSPKKGAQGGTFVHHEEQNFSRAHNYQADTPRGRGGGRERVLYLDQRPTYRKRAGILQTAQKLRSSNFQVS